VGIGPGIRKCHFDIKPENAQYYNTYPDVIERKENTIFVDLPAIIKTELNKNGVSVEYVEDNKLCTYCLEDTYFSYRRDKPQQVHAMIAYIGISDVRH
jgi:copper oxidase (laccase) domain-containing protein